MKFEKLQNKDARMPRFMLEGPRRSTIFYLCYMNSFPIGSVL